MKAWYLALFLMCSAWAAQPTLTIEQERTVQHIGMKIHCPICSGESIAQSQTEIARDMLAQVRSMIAEGKTEPEILNFFTASYGERILLEPPRNGLTSLLWNLPLVLLVLGALGWWWYIRRDPMPAQELTVEEEARIQELLK